MHRIILDIGNSTTRIALMDEFTVQAMRIVPNDGIASGRDVAAVTGDLIGADTHGVQAVVCSVVPAIADLAREGLRMHAGIEVIDVDVRRVDWFEIAYETPETLGSDRLCAVIAARALYGWPAVVIDFGTATTVNVLDGAGRFLGGSISPGIGLSFRVLHTGTAQLPDVGGRQATRRPRGR